MPLVTLVLPQGINDNFFERIWESMDEVFGNDLRTIYINDPAKSKEQASRSGELIQNIDCDLSELLSGLYYMLGDTGLDEQVLIPCRSPDAEELSANRVYKVINQDRLQRIEENLAIVHTGLIDKESDHLENQSFFRGNKITWADLDVNADVQRDLMPRLKEKINQSLLGYRNTRIYLEHMPGAGGTTSARRLAWDFKDLFPTVLLRKFSSNTSDRIEELFHFTKIPVLVIIETIKISSAQIDHLFRNLKARNCRASLIIVSRSIRPNAEFSIADPLGERETEKFLKKYLQNSMPERHHQLSELAHRQEFQQYRSPFFFGLYAFEKDFVHIPQWVNAHLKELKSTETKRVILFLSLITRFSQHSISAVQLNRLFNITSRKPIRINELFGVSAESANFIWAYWV